MEQQKLEEISDSAVIEKKKTQPKIGRRIALTTLISGGVFIIANFLRDLISDSIKKTEKTIIPYKGE